jgi:HPr kinase/phosphorylase
MKPIRIQGVLVMVQGVGVLVLGAPGTGKSLAALNLMRGGHHLVADDLVEVFPGPQGEPIGRAVEENVRIEVRGLGIYRARSLFPEGAVPSAPIHFAVELAAYDPARDLGRTSPETGEMRLLETTILKVRVPVATGTEPALLIELLARIFKKNGTVTP